MPISLEELTQHLADLQKQVAGLLDIVESQEKDIQVHTTQNRRLEEHGIAVLAAFAGFAHILVNKGLVSRSDIAAVFQEMTTQSGMQEKTPEALKFLQGLAEMISTPLSREEDKSSGPYSKH